MIANLALTCTRCGADLSQADQQLSMRTPAGLRHAYECSCGGITITVASDSRAVVGHH